VSIVDVFFVGSYAARAGRRTDVTVPGRMDSMRSSAHVMSFAPSRQRASIMSLEIEWFLGAGFRLDGAIAEVGDRAKPAGGRRR
jgi:hypothetical protein